MASTKRKAVIDERPAKKSKISTSNPEPKAKKSKDFAKPTDSSERKPVAQSVLVQDERAFPRGGASVLTPLEHKQIKAQAERDVLFEHQTGQHISDGEDPTLFNEHQRKRPIKKQRHARNNERSKETERTKSRIHGLSFKNLSVGSLTLGYVTAITERDVALALPNNITGYVPITAISERLNQRIQRLLEDDGSDQGGHEDVDLKSMFYHGQWLRALVSSTTSEEAQGDGKRKRHIGLTINPEDINTGLDNNDFPVNSMVQASVRSIEDHGVVMDLGLADSSVKGFISKKEVGATFTINDLQQGQVLMCLVTGKGSSGAVMKLSPDASRFSALSGGKTAPSLSEALSVNAFQPGTAVDVLITESTAGGVVGKIMGMVDVTADLVHSMGTSSAEPNQKFKVGSKTKGRIIWTMAKDDGTRQIGISLLEHLLVLPPPSSKLAENASAKLRTYAAEVDQALSLSSIIEDSKITRVIPERGVFMTLPSTSGRAEDAFTAFANLSQMSDKPNHSIDSATGTYRVGTTHKARVVSYNPVDRLYYVALKQSIIDQQYLRIEDVVIGEKVKAKIEKLLLGSTGVTGMLVKLSDSVTGLVPAIHFSDTALQHPERKFKEGSTVKARVLSVDREKKQIRLTVKKTLVSDDDPLPIWEEYTRLEPGMESKGTVVKLLPGGAFLQFYGNVRAWLPVAEMSEVYIERPEQHFRLGQTLSVRVLSVDPDMQELKVSCKDEQPFSMEQLSAWESATGGVLVSGVAIEKAADSATVELSSGLKGLITINHLTDGSDKKAENALKKVHVGKEMFDMLVLRKLNRSHQLLLTKKPSMVADAKAGEIVRELSDLAEGMQVHGFVRNVTPEGIYVEFANTLVGLLPKRNVSHELLELPAFGLLKDQSITAWVTNIDTSNSRFILSMEEQNKIGKPTRALSLPVTNPVDSSITSLNDFVLGKITKARIASIKSTQINVRLADNVQGRIDMSEVFDTWEEIQNKKCPLQKFKANEVLDVKILGVHDSKSHRFLPISHRQSTIPVFELSAKRARIFDGDETGLSMGSIKEHDSYVAFVNNHQENCVWASISPNVKGRLILMDLSSQSNQLLNVTKHFPLGCALVVSVKSVDPLNERLDLSANNGAPEHLDLQDITTGMIVAGRATKLTERSIFVHLSDSLAGIVSLVEVSDDYDDLNLSQYKKNDILRTRVLDVDAPNKRVHLTLRPSQVLSSSLPVKDRHITRYDQLKVGDIVRGFVHNVGERGVFVQLGARVNAMVRITDLSDNFIKDWQKIVQIDELVRGRVIFVDSAARQIHLSLKASQVDENYIPPISIQSLEPGLTVTGKVRKVEDFGAFIDIDNTQPRLSGLCHRSEVAARRIDDVRSVLSPGDTVKAKILKVDVGARKISLGLKATYFMEEGNEEDSASDEGADYANGVLLDTVDTLPEHEEDDSEQSQSSTEDQSIYDEMEVEEISPTGGLKTNGFDWTGQSLELKASGDVSEAEGGVPVGKKRKRNKSEIKEDLTGDLDKYGPRNIADFERQLLGQPNDSQLWIQYMAFQLELSELQSARDIAERALRTINIRESVEKANVWIAWLNLEVEYGDEDRVEDIFTKACQVQDPLEMHEKLASIYIRSGKLDKADTIFEQIVGNKSFRGSPDVWLNYATFLMDEFKAPDRARSLLSRALHSLPTNEHRQLTANFAALEFRSAEGDAERGRTIFESIISEWPKWTSGWDMLIDLERSRIAHTSSADGKDAARLKVRALYERLASQKMKQRRAKFVFKKWLEFEEAEGTSKTSARVKALAQEYVAGQQASQADRMTE